MRIASLIESLEAWAPLELAESWDNVGFQIGAAEAEIAGVLVTLDVTREVLEEAEEMGANLVISHHPLIFEPLKRINTELPPGSLIGLLLRRKMHLYVMHTNLDAAPGGVNSILAERLSLRETAVLHPAAPPNDGCGLGVLGTLPAAVSLRDFVGRVEAALDVAALTYSGSPESLVQRVAACGGSGGALLEEAVAKGADVYVTGDVKHHDYLAVQGRMALIDAGHFETEVSVLEAVAARVRELLPDGVRVTVSTTCSNPVRVSRKRDA